MNKMKRLVKKLVKKNMLHKETNLELIKRKVNEATSRTMADVLSTCYKRFCACNSCDFQIDNGEGFVCSIGHKKLMERDALNKED
jgi:hypothetical protein